MMKFHLPKPDADNDYDMVKFYESEDGITERNIEEKLYQVGKTLRLEVGAYMIAGIEGDRYTELLGCFLYSDVRELAMFSKNVPERMKEVWRLEIKDEEIIK